jgi:hypothetical protein
MTKATERIVVFVTTAEKQAIVSIADRMGVSMSELMRQAVQNFAAAAQQVKVAALVERMQQPKYVDPVAAALERPRNGTRLNRVAKAQAPLVAAPTPAPPSDDPAQPDENAAAPSEQSDQP